MDLLVELPGDVIDLLGHCLLCDVHVALHKLYGLLSRSSLHRAHFLLVGFGDAVQLPVEELLVELHDLWGHRDFGEASSISFIRLHSLLKRSLL